MTRAALRCLLLATLLGGCAEMREPPLLSRVPPGLGVDSADPVPAMAAEAASALARAGAGLPGQPATTARAFGRMELIAAEFRRNPRWAPLPTAVETELRTARLEWRSALGIRSGAAPEAVATALGRAALALEARDSRAAAGALDPAIFEPGGNPTLARLAAPGPLPQSQIASGLARDETARLALFRLGGPTGALDPNAGLLGGQGGIVTPQLR